jgi:hypothetical protein
MAITWRAARRCPIGTKPGKESLSSFSLPADTLQRELVVYRKGAIAKAFLARKTNESRIVDNGRERLETDADHRPLVSVNPDSVAELAPGALNAQPLRFANGNSKLPAQPVKADSDAWIRRADELLAKHPSANYHRASELYQFATSMLSTLYGVESPEMQSLRSNAESASKDKSAFQAGHISLLAQGAIKAARDDLKAGLTGSLKSAPEIVPISTIKGAVTGALLSRYRSEIKRAILTQLALNPKATDGEICRGLDADGSVELPSRWKSKVSDRGFFDAYSDTVRRHKVEVTISKVRKDLRRQGLLD